MTLIVNAIGEISGLCIIDITLVEYAGSVYLGIGFTFIPTASRAEYPSASCAGGIRRPDVLPRGIPSDTERKLIDICDLSCNAMFDVIRIHPTIIPRGNHGEVLESRAPEASVETKVGTLHIISGDYS
jgi:hypothetical protein